MAEPFDLLDSFGLVYPEDASLVVARWDDAELLKFFELYLSNSQNRPLPEPPPAGSLSVFADTWSGDIDLQLIRRLLLFLDRFHLNDPVPNIFGSFREIDVTASTASRESRVTAIRQSLVESLSDLLALKPLARDGIVSVQPVSISELASPPGAYTAQDFFYPDGTPVEDPFDGIDYADKLTALFGSRMEAYPFDFLTGKPALGADGTPLPTRSIRFRIQGDAAWETRLKHDVHTDPSRPTGDNYPISMFMDPRDLLPVDHFKNWMRAELQKLVVRRSRIVTRDVRVARILGASLLTGSSVTRDLLPVVTGQSVDDRSPVPVLASVQLPYFDKVTCLNLATARRDEVAFETFRRELARVLVELAAMPSEEDRTRRSSELIRDLITAPLLKVEEVNARLRRNLFLDALIGAGTLSGVLIAAAASAAPAAVLATLGLVGAGTEAIKTIKEFVKSRDALKDTPGFFYWEALGEGGRRP